MKADVIPRDERTEEISALIATLHETEQRLDQLTDGEVDAILNRDGASIFVRRARAQLRESEAARQVAILNALPAHVALLDCQGVIISVNDAWRHFADANSLDRSDYGVGEDYLDVCDRARGDYASEATEVSAGIRAILAGQSGRFSVEYPCSSPTEPRWFLLTVSPLSTEGAAGAVVMHLDITERKLAENALEVLSHETQRRERILNTTLSSISDFAYILDRKGHFLFANQPLLNFRGITLQEAMGRDLFDMGYPREKVEQMLRQVEEVFTTGKSIADETSSHHRSGTVGHFEYIFSPVIGPDGSVEFVAGSSRDITQRKSTEVALRESDEKFRHLADNIADAFWIRSPDMETVHYVSPAFERIWGRSVETLYNDPKRWSDFIVPQDRERVLTGFAGLTREDAELDMEYRIVRPDGEVRWVRARGFQVRDHAGELIRNTGIVTDITDQHHAAETVQTTLDEFRTLAEAMPQIVWVTRHDGRNLYFNQRWLDYTGSTLAESVGQAWNSQFHPDDQQRAWDVRQEATAAAATYSLEARLRRADGTYRWFLVRGVPLLDAAGSILKWFGTSTDIHDLKLAEMEVSRSNQELRESERRFSDMLGNVDMISVMLDTRGCITYCNDYLLQLTDWSREDVIGRDWFELFIPDDQDLRRSFSQLLANEPAMAHHENVILTRSGARRLIKWNNTTLHSTTGAPIGTASIGDDITDRREAEARLRLQSAALIAAETAMIITDRDRSIVWINPAFTKLSGYSAHEAIGANAHDLLRSGVHDEAFYEEIGETILSGRSWSGEMTNRRKDGRLYSEAQTITPVRAHDGTISHFIAIKTDLTEKHQMEERLRQAQKMEAVGQLAAGVAHEFNNLLQALMSMATIIRMRSTTADATKIGTEMESQIRRGATLTQQLLTFSRHQASETCDVDLRHEVQKASVLLRRLIPENIRITVEQPAGPLTVQGDPGQLQQVMLNLAINARDAMPAGGTITLRSGSIHGEVFLDVSDTGHGIDEPTRGHIFEPFFTTKDPGKGTGLGLAVVHGIVEQHRGRIEVSSAPREGSRFRVILPAAFSNHVVEHSSVEMQDKTPVGAGRILLVEDEHDVREAVALLLDMIGYEVTAVASGEKAIALTMDVPPDVLLSDVSLAGIAGPTLGEQLLERWPAMRVVLMSGYFEEPLRTRASSRGWHFLQKPFELSDLAATLQTALDTPVVPVSGSSSALLGNARLGHPD